MIVDDFRSDTVTRPGEGMRAAMAAAEVGDAVYDDCPTTKRLEAMTAERLGKEAALFFPTGTQANLAGLMAHCGRGEEYIVGQMAHTYRLEGGGAAVQYVSTVDIRRWGGGVFPVEVRVTFADGRTADEGWDGRARWTRFRYVGKPAVRRAVVDPRRKLALDVNPANNSWVEEKGLARRAARKWATRWMFWLQNLLELQTVLT